MLGVFVNKTQQLTDLYSNNWNKFHNIYKHH